MKNSLLLFLALAVPLSFPACGSKIKTSDTRVVVLGIDGLDPDMLLERVERGMLPNFAKLLEQGSLYEKDDALGLQTSWPPQSPVAWSNFITGVNPGKHGLYDFIHVDRKNYGVANSMSYTDEIGTELNLFGMKMPLSGGEQHLTRDFPAFWESLDEAGVPVAVYRMPANFPVEPTGAVTFPDMGTPDLAGTASGRAFLWTADMLNRSEKKSDFYHIGFVDVIQNGEVSAKVFGSIEGPPNTLWDTSDLEKAIEQAREAGDPSEEGRLRTMLEAETSTSTPFTAHIDKTGEAPRLAVEVEGEWGIAELGGWTDWVRVEFKLAKFIPIAGYMRFMFKSVAPFELYGTPIQMDPFSPAMPISTPDDAAADLAEAIGPYYTQGFPDAYIAYKSDLLNTAEFVSQSDTVMEERRNMLDYALDQFDPSGGLLFFYFGSLDLRNHMLWHTQDPLHPHQEEDGAEYADQIDRVYQQMDEVVGDIMARLEAYPDVTFMIMSDHGFAPFHRKMHVNDWLYQEGYLVLKEGIEHRPAEGEAQPAGFYRDDEFLGSSVRIYTVKHDENGDPDWDSGMVDWSKSKAYAIGFNGVILNRVGREPKGIVTEAQADGLLNEMKAKLMTLTDGGKPVFSRVEKASDVFSGAHLDKAPDLQLGFNTDGKTFGFGASDECATGEITGEGVMVDNDSRWSGSHLVDPDLVRGTLLVNKKVSFLRDPRLEDVTATLYSLFQVQPPEGMDGEPLFQP
ncbi:MAG: hypothetical protein DWQ01_15995 [Planctomycetota bacterium]|nr:MAG: hypothetical protein DWQ01_15995 [Planctomycetota bacterium]